MVQFLLEGASTLDPFCLPRFPPWRSMEDQHMAGGSGVLREQRGFVHLKVCFGFLRGLPTSDYGERLYNFDILDEPENDYRSTWTMNYQRSTQHVRQIYFQFKTPYTTIETKVFIEQLTIFLSNSALSVVNNSNTK
jgi:hypothetical protein